MARVRITSSRVIRLSGVLVKGDVLDGPDAELDALVQAGSAKWVSETPEPETTVVGFASSAASDFAAEEGLTAAEFEGIEPSGKGGFTKADVEAVVQARG
jgi:hypothetical protein